MSKILVVCDQGNNRSVTLAHQLKYLGHDVLSAGFATNGEDTLAWLWRWADKIILVDKLHYDALLKVEEIVGAERSGNVELWNIGPDIYPRPFNKELLKICKRLIAEHREEL